MSTSAASSGRTLASLAKGEAGVVADVTGDDALAARLMEMGLIPGESATFVGAAPLGDPLEFSLRGGRLSLRKAEAARVLIEPA